MFLVSYLQFVINAVPEGRKDEPKSMAQDEGLGLSLQEF